MTAGTLSLLGYHVPQPVLRTNRSNPKGFFESKWPVAFHRRLMDACLVTAADARPEAFERMASAVGSGTRAELRAWLSGVFDEVDRVVVKDPRAAWLPNPWLDTAEALDARARVLLMVRHPAEVTAMGHAARRSPQPESPRPTARARPANARGPRRLVRSLIPYRIRRWAVHARGRR